MACFVAVTSVSSVSSSSIVTSSTVETSSSVASTPSSSPAVSQPMIAVTMATQQPQPVVTATDQLVSNSSDGGGTSDTSMMSKLSGLLSMLPTKPTFPPAIQPSTIIPSVSPSPPVTTTSEAIPAGNDRTATPVKDEPQESVSEEPDRQQPRVVDPIAMLNQMLSQSRPASTTSSSSVDFLQSLSMLTKTVTSAGETSASPGDDIYMGGYGKLNDDGPFTTTWSNRCRSDPDTGPPVKPLDRETSPAALTAVEVPAALALQSEGPPTLKSVYGTPAVSDVTSCCSNLTASAPSPVDTSAVLRDHVLSSLSVNSNSFPATTQNLDNTSSLSDKFAFRSDSTPYPLPGLDIDTMADSGHHSRPLTESTSTVSFPFKSAIDTAAVASNILPSDEFTERLRKKTSMPVSDGMASPPFPDSQGVVPAQTRDRMFDEGAIPPPTPPANNLAPVYHDRPVPQPPTLNPLSNNLPPQPPVYHDQPQPPTLNPLPQPNNLPPQPPAYHDRPIPQPRPLNPLPQPNNLPPQPPVYHDRPVPQPPTVNPLPQPNSLPPQRPAYRDQPAPPPPPFDPLPNNLPPQPPVYQDEPEVDADYDRYGRRFDEWPMEDQNHKEFQVSPLRPPDPVYRNQFSPRQSESVSMFPRPRPEFYSPLRARVPVPREDFRPRFMSRLPPPAAFSAMRPPPLPPRDCFQRPFFPRF